MKLRDEDPWWAKVIGVAGALVIGYYVAIPFSHWVGDSIRAAFGVPLKYSSAPARPEQE